MTKNRTTAIPSKTASAKYENYTKKVLQTGSNPVTIKASGASYSMRIFCQKSQAISDRKFGQNPCH